MREARFLLRATDEEWRQIEEAARRGGYPTARWARETLLAATYQEATMSAADRPRSGETTYHRDGTVTIWDVYRQGWVRGVPGDQLLATLSEPERAKVIDHTDHAVGKTRDTCAKV